MPLSFDIFLSTFNCAKNLPFKDEERLEDLISTLIPCDTKHQVYVLGFQELVPIWQGSFPQLVEQVLSTVSRIAVGYLNESSAHTTYTSVYEKTCGAIGLIIIANSTLDIKNALGCSIGCGMFYSSLKGGAAAKFTVRDAGEEISDTFVIICAHMAANEGPFYTERRVSDFETICTSVREELGPFKANHVFFLGDLNFRASQLLMNDLESASLSERHQVFSRHDELSRLRREGRIFQGFEEGNVSFLPTYKLKRTTRDRIYDSRRSPSWCDRILFKKYENTFQVEIYDTYARSEILQLSDHLPVKLSINVPHIHEDNAPIEIFITPPFRKWTKIIGKLSDVVIGYSGWIYAITGPYPLLLSVIILILFLWLK
ncbi:LAMI_0H19482g1_1 [Lachancea mirantina]|uniref:LAMI_0H19482g1_1 n=1 Tax=Lachancea mirantina TaxID=1230905 RepID=A0A1G4KJR9_9SACH|nr:LAMI_0H19482g1_1 [Lachancea mirantina]